LASLRHEYLGSFFVGPEEIKVLGSEVLRRKPQFTFCVSVRAWLSLRHA